MKLNDQTYEETLYRADVIGEAFAFIDWHRNDVTVKLPEETVFDATERKIRKVQKLGNVELFQNGA